jgi:hypothetical protein
MRRLRAEQPSVAGEKFTWAAVGKGFVDWKTWVGSLMYIGVDAPLYAFSVFTPTIVRALGYSSINANLLSVPIYVLACKCPLPCRLGPVAHTSAAGIVTVFVGLAANKYKDRRAQLSLGFLCVGIGGYVVLAASRLPGLSYGAIFFAACGIYPLCVLSLEIETCAVADFAPSAFPTRLPSPSRASRARTSAPSSAASSSAWAICRVRLPAHTPSNKR